jgi:hypothetical protein
MATTTYGTPYVSGTDLVANWPAASLTVANSIDAAGYYVGRGINAQTASYTGVLTDAGKTVTMTNAGATTFTVPANASVAYPTGTRINILNLGAGACTPTAGAGVTISGTITALAINESAAVIKTATNTWSYLAAPTPGLSLVATGTASAASSVIFNNVFTSAADNYRIVVHALGDSAAVMNARLRASGVDASGLNYDYASRYAGPAGTTGDNGSGADQSAWATVSVQSQYACLAFDIFSPALAVRTEMFGTAIYNSFAVWFGGTHKAGTAYDGISLYPVSGTFTGTARIYKYAN